MENVNDLGYHSELRDKIAPYIDGYKVPADIVKEIAKQVKIDEQAAKQHIDEQMNELAKKICPKYMLSGETLDSKYRKMVLIELRALHPNSEVVNEVVKEELNINGGGCYVATAVYGSYDCPQVWTLRRYRDYSLAETWYGRAFIHTYYAISPTLVKWFGHTEWFKKMWKGKLDRMVRNLQEQGFEATPYEDRNWR